MKKTNELYNIYHDFNDAQHRLNDIQLIFNDLGHRLSPI